MADPTPQSTHDHREPIEFGVADAVQQIWRARWLIVAAILIGAAIGAVVSLGEPTMYEATATVSVRLASGDAPTAADVAKARKVLESRTAAADVVRDLGLEPEYHITPEAFAVRHVRTAQVAASELLQVFVRLPRPDLAARAANSLVDHSLAAAKTPPQLQTNAFQEEELRKAHVRVESAEEQVRAYKRDAQLDVLRQAAELALRRRARASDLGVEIDTERARIAALEEQVARMPAGADTPSEGLHVVASPRLLDETATDAQQHVASSVADALRYDLAIRRTKLSALQREQHRIAEGGDGARSRLHQYDALYDRESTLDRLVADYNVASDLYRDLLVRAQAIRIAAAARAVMLEAIDPAYPPDRPVSPRTKLNVATGAALGLVLSIVFAFAARLLQANQGNGPA